MKCDLFIDILQKLRGKYSTVFHTAMLSNHCWVAALHVMETQPKVGAAVSIYLTKSNKIRGYNTPDHFCAYFVHCLKIYNISSIESVLSGPNLTLELSTIGLLKKNKFFSRRPSASSKKTCFFLVVLFFFFFFIYVGGTSWH